MNKGQKLFTRHLSIKLFDSNMKLLIDVVKTMNSNR
jgi:hypothetical protein